MSDFDKEAEREKLREKFADDEEKRNETRRMSELLLKGATMTNKHCGRCSDPLFRYDGQTFCPSCQTEGEAVQAEADAGETRTEAAPEGQQSTPVDPGSQVDHPSQSEPQSQVDPQANAGGADPTTETTRSTQPQTSRTTQPQAGSPERISPVGEQGEKTKTSGVDSHTGSSTGGLTEARQSLTRTVTRFAQDAERTDDPRRARELLAAAREAAATLAELE